MINIEYERLAMNVRYAAPMFMFQRTRCKTVGWWIVLVQFENLYMKSTSNFSIVSLNLRPTPWSKGQRLAPIFNDYKNLLGFEDLVRCSVGLLFLCSDQACCCSLLIQGDKIFLKFAV